jgi:hypothetical protein
MVGRAMPTNKKSSNRRTRGWFRRDNRRALAICLLFGAAASIGLGSVIQQAPTIGTLRIAGNGPGLTQSDDELATGSIIIVPVLGSNCRKKLIDNATWRIRDIGPVDCRTALARGAHGNESGWSASRVDIIRSGFYSR